MTDLKYSQLIPEDGDAAILIRDHGRGMYAVVRHGADDQDYTLVNLHGSIETTYAPEGGLKPIRFKIVVGPTAKQWAKEMASIAPPATAKDAST